MGNPIVLEMAYSLGTADFSLQLERLKNENLDAIIHWGDDSEGAQILNQMRAMGMEQPYFACDRCLSEEFIEVAGTNAERVICTSPWNPKSKNNRLTEFRNAFWNRFGEEAETFAAHAYDGMNMLIWAVQVAGLNRAKIRDVLAYRFRPWKGVTGDIMLSSCLDDVGDVYLAKRENGTWNFYSREDLKISQGYIHRRDRVSALPVSSMAPLSLGKKSK
jgi:ABC-type branched-subunit amino acid transport system substrate-binding protein